ncbi:hypothetical protein [Persephonella sp.]
MNNYFEEIYNLYKESLNDSEKELQDLAEEMGLDYKYPQKTVNTKKPVYGDIFLLIHKGIPIYYIFIEKEENFYKVAKVSEFWRLANQNDLLVKINNEQFIVEPWNKFYLTEEEYKKSTYIGSLAEEDKKILIDYLEGRITDLPENKRGLNVPEGNYNFYQNKFHKDEALLVKEFALRVFQIIEESEPEFLIELPPERLQQQPLAAGEGKESYREKNFILFYNKDEDFIEMEITDEGITGKKGVIKVFDKEFYFEEIPETVILEIPEEIKDINIDYIGENIEVLGR